MSFLLSVISVAFVSDVAEVIFESLNFYNACNSGRLSYKLNRASYISCCISVAEKQFFIVNNASAMFAGSVYGLRLCNNIRF